MNTPKTMKNVRTGCLGRFALERYPSLAPTLEHYEALLHEVYQLHLQILAGRKFRPHLLATIPTFKLGWSRRRINKFDRALLAWKNQFSKAENKRFYNTTVCWARGQNRVLSIKAAMEKYPPRGGTR